MVYVFCLVEAWAKGRIRAMQIRPKPGCQAFAMSELGPGFPWPFLTILVFWLVTLFVSFGLLAPRNATVLCIIFFCSLSVASAVFLIVDMEHPFFGFVQVSSAPLRDALDQLGR